MNFRFLKNAFLYLVEDNNRKIEIDKKQPRRSDYEPGIYGRSQYERDHEQWKLDTDRSGAIGGFGIILIFTILLSYYMGLWLYPLPVILLFCAAIGSFALLGLIASNFTGEIPLIIALGVPAVVTIIVGILAIRLEKKLSSIPIYYWIRHVYRLVTLAVLIFYIHYFFQFDQTFPKDINDVIRSLSTLVPITLMTVGVGIAHFKLISRKDI
ncbi:hypothetical protein [Sphaerospermopsis sp. LEGE 08334]|jgi:hypothetical protein|uniref:hypothetical protein n=1 Tax=Sphaerospermopsis sp. LEGE 08334 TaxID=1828651 RepID=UPI0018826211|nr:hypothetical protein [Sphaerospermopsis sp. LEGE 08334]MBE9058775.1 hypothetical protein [Sphaerospermopsis sp. LEGE 08334]